MRATEAGSRENCTTALPSTATVAVSNSLDIMTPEFIYVRTETKLTRVLQLMVDHRLKSMPVIEGDQRLAGMISREDVMRALQQCTR
jgi:CBS domain-containing protein